MLNKVDTHAESGLITDHGSPSNLSLAMKSVLVEKTIILYF